MYLLWGRNLKKLNRRLKRWIESEKENEDTEIYEGLVYVKELTMSALRLYHRIMRREFVRLSEGEELFERMELAVKSFNAFVMYYSVPPENTNDVPFSELH